MFRWAVLSITFLVWLSCMTLVYAHYRPRQSVGRADGPQAGLDAIFGEDADDIQIWRMYVDPQRLKNNPPGASAWTGLDESKLIDVGWMRSELKKRKNDETRREQITHAEIRVPPEANIPGTQLLGQIIYHNRSDISLDHGLEVFDSLITLSLGFSVASHGNRDGDYLKLQTQVLQDGKMQFENKRSIPINDKDTPTLELMPFQRNREIRKDYTWQIATLDTSSIDVTGSNKPSIVSVKATCTGRRDIKYEGHYVTVLEARTEDGKARAWYSPDGLVLKQSYRLADTLDLIVVRVDPKNFDQYKNTEQPFKKSPRDR